MTLISVESESLLDGVMIMQANSIVTKSSHVCFRSRCVLKVFSMNLPPAGMQNQVVVPIKN